MKTTGRSSRRALALAGALALLVACGDAEEVGEPTDAVDEEGEEDPDAPEETDDPEGDTGDGAIEDSLVDEVAEAVEAAAAEADVTSDEITVVSAGSVTWSDGALGCPQPGEVYTQALVEGYRIELNVDGDTRYYHGADGDEPFHCADPQEPADTGETS